MKRILPATLCALALFAAYAAPAAAQGLPGATVRSEGRSGASPAERDAMRERCKANPEQCREQMKSRMRERCRENPQQCEEMRAKIKQRHEQCKADPEKCQAERRAYAERRFKKADSDGNGAISRGEAEKGMPRLARHFDRIDANKDGQLSVAELQAARQAHGGGKGRKQESN
ncbi:MAG: EF-hand domain-containing protein [Betaproteobacteria bacterium]|nr:EF-hand domain-containing protein [Betaproteobacteria bacterium]